jgi:hypothetical protein
MQRAIDAIVTKTQNLVDKFFVSSSSSDGTPAKQPSATYIAPSSKSQKLKEGYQWVTMEDGTKVQVKIPEIMK